jgi:hypothetical protein
VQAVTAAQPSPVYFGLPSCVDLQTSIRCTFVPVQVIMQSGYAVPTEDYIQQNIGQVPSMGAGGHCTAILDVATNSLKYLSAAWLIDAPVLQKQAKNIFVLRNRLHLQIGMPPVSTQTSRDSGLPIVNHV